MKLSEIKKISQQLSVQNPGAFAANLHYELSKLGIDSGTFYQELQMDSLYVDTHQDLSYSNTNIHLHSHAFYEILCCRNTCGTEYLVNSERYKLQKGDIIFVPPGVSHRPLLPETVVQPYTRDVLWISETFMNNVVAVLPNMDPIQFSKPGLFRTADSRWEYICDMFRQGVAEAEAKNECWEAVVCANTVTILSHLVRASFDIHAKPMKAEKPELLDQVLGYVETNLAARLTLADIARQFYVSESTITQMFRKKMGVSFYRCVTQRRLITAKALIEQGLSMETVADSVGFSDYSSFFRAFKQEFGISPRQYRKMHING